MLAKGMKDVYVRPLRSMPLSERVLEAELCKLERARKKALDEAQRSGRRAVWARERAERIGRQMGKVHD